MTNDRSRSGPTTRRYLNYQGAHRLLGVHNLRVGKPAENPTHQKGRAFEI